MNWLKVGHTTCEDKGTGISVFLFDPAVCGAYHVCGSAPATVELPAMNLENIVKTFNALVLTGGSALGLSATAGVMRWMNEHKQGLTTPYGLVPIIPAAAIYDLGVKQPLPPTAEDAYQACVAATSNNFASGMIGAGRGATVGKLVPNTKPSSGGIGCAKIEIKGGISVLAYAVVNSVGDVRDTSGQIIAGAMDQNNQFSDTDKYLLSGDFSDTIATSNTCLVTVFIDADLSQIELKRIAKMAVAGMGSCISPVFTRYDGDVIFCFANGDKKAPEMVVGTMAAKAVQQAIINAVKR